MALIYPRKTRNYPLRSNFKPPLSETSLPIHHRINNLINPLIPITLLLPPPPPNNRTHLLPLRRVGQVLVPQLRDQDIILDAHAADGVVFLQDVDVDVSRVDGVAEEIPLEVLTAEVAVQC